MNKVRQHRAKAEVFGIVVLAELVYAIARGGFPH
jgi:hypothetical protein